MSWSLVVVLVLIVLVDAWQDHRDYAKRLDSPAGPARMQRRRIMKWIFAGMVRSWTTCFPS
jgi:1,4-dihydroxy-2-naphthoate octaprenyltransferase